MAGLPVVGLSVVAPSLTPDGYAEAGPCCILARGIHYLTGGVARIEANAFRHELNKCPLAIELLENAGRQDEFTAGAQVKIVEDAGRTVFTAKADGPFTLAWLQPATYAVTATLATQTLHKAGVMVVRGNPVRTIFEFPPHMG